MQEQPLNGQSSQSPMPVPSLPQPAAQPLFTAQQVQSAQPGEGGAPLPPVQQPAASAAPVAAENGDVIEKEWVNRVKQAVIETAHDPFLQNQQLTKLKAEYLQKRYGKAVKSGD